MESLVSEGARNICVRNDSLTAATEAVCSGDTLFHYKVYQSGNADGNGLPRFGRTSLESTGFSSEATSNTSGNDCDHKRTSIVRLDTTTPAVCVVEPSTTHVGKEIRGVLNLSQPDRQNCEEPVEYMIIDMKTYSNGSKSVANDDLSNETLADQRRYLSNNNDARDFSEHDESQKPLCNGADCAAETDSDVAMHKENLNEKHVSACSVVRAGGRRKQARPFRVCDVTDGNVDASIQQSSQSELIVCLKADDLTAAVKSEEPIMCHQCGHTETSEQRLEQHIKAAHSSSCKRQFELVAGGKEGDEAFPTKYHRLGNELLQEVESSCLDRRQLKLKLLESAESSGQNDSGYSDGSMDRLSQSSAADSNTAAEDNDKEHNVRTPSSSSSRQEEAVQKLPSAIDIMSLLNSQQMFDSLLQATKGKSSDETAMFMSSLMKVAADAASLDGKPDMKPELPVFRGSDMKFSMPSFSGKSGDSKLDMSMFQNSRNESKSNADMDDYCDRCQKHFCNKYYLRKHKQDVHGIMPGDSDPYSRDFKYHHVSFSNSNTSTKQTDYSSFLPFPNLPGVPSIPLLPVSSSPSTSLPFVLPFSSIAASSLSSGNCDNASSMKSVMSSLSKSHDALAAVDFSSAGIMPDLSSMTGLLPGMLPALSSLSSLASGLSGSSMSDSLSGMSTVPGLSSIPSLLPNLMFLNPFASPLSLLKSASPFLQNSVGSLPFPYSSAPNFASASLNTLAELQNIGSASRNAGSSSDSAVADLAAFNAGLAGAIAAAAAVQEPGAVDSSNALLMKFDQGLLGSGSEQNSVKCELCSKEFCNSYFVKIHKRDKHGIPIPGALEQDKQSSASPFSSSAMKYLTGIDPGEKGESLVSSNIESSHYPDKYSSTSADQTSDTCRICKRQFSNRYSLMMHIVNTHNTTPEGFGLASELLQLDKLNGSMKSPLGQSLKLGSSSTTSLNPAQNAKLSDRVSCDICHKEVCNKYFLKTHKMKVHGLDAIQAEMGLSSLSGGDAMSQQENRMISKDDEMMQKYFSSLMSRDLSTKSEASSEAKSHSESQHSGRRRHRHHHHSSSHRSATPVNHGENSRGSSGHSGGNMMTTLGLIAKQKEAATSGFDLSASGRSRRDSGSAKDEKPDVNNLHPLAPFFGLNPNDLQMAFNASIAGLPGFNPQLSFDAFQQSHLMKQHASGLSSMSGHKLHDQGPSGAQSITEEDLIKSGIDPEAYCDICQKEFCSKYFLKTHRQKIHGLQADGKRVQGFVASSESPASAFSDPTGLQSLQATQLQAKLLQDVEKYSVGQMAGMPGGGDVGGHANRGSASSSTGSRVTCEFCGKELCNKYFLKTHMMKLHGVSSSYSTSGLQSADAISTTSPSNVESTSNGASSPVSSGYTFSGTKSTGFEKSGHSLGEDGERDVQS